MFSCSDTVTKFCTVQENIEARQVFYVFASQGESRDRGDRLSSRRQCTVLETINVSSFATCHCPAQESAMIQHEIGQE